MERLISIDVVAVSLVLMFFTSPSFRPSASQLLLLSQGSPADNSAGLDTALHWKSDLFGAWLQASYFGYQSLRAVKSFCPDYSPLAIGAKFAEQWFEQSVLAPVQMSVRDSVHRHTDPDLFRQQNVDIETRYAALIYEICDQFFDCGIFSEERVKHCFSSPVASQAFYSKLIQMAALEFSYHSIGLTRLTALKELFSTLVMLLTDSELPHPHPYRKYDENGQPLDSFEQYLAHCQHRLEQLYQHDAFDLINFSEQSPTGDLGCSPYQVLPDSLMGGVKLRYYPSSHQSANTNPVLYLSSPLINRPEIFDLTEGKSVIQGLLSEGYHVYLVDFTDVGEYQFELGLEFFGKVVHDQYLEIVGKRHPKQQIHALGYCMGGTLLLAYLARRAEERALKKLPMDITKVVLMATPVYFDDNGSGHRSMRRLIRHKYEPELMQKMFNGVNVPPQIIETGMQYIQPGVRYSVNRGFFERATFDNAIEDSAAFLNWLNHGTKFPVRAHQQWVQNVFSENQIFNDKFRLPSVVAELDGEPVDMHALTRAGVQIMDYRGLRDPISPVGSCIASATWGVNHDADSATTNGLNRTIEKNIGHIFVVSRKHLGEFLERTVHFYQAH